MGFTYTEEEYTKINKEYRNYVKEYKKFNKVSVNKSRKNGFAYQKNTTKTKRKIKRVFSMKGYKKKRNKKEMIELKESGKTYMEMGKILGVTYQRVQQILSCYGYKEQKKEKISVIQRTCKNCGVNIEKGKQICIDCLRKKQRENTNKWQKENKERLVEYRKQYYKK